MDNCIYCGIWDVPFTKYKGMCLQIFVKKEHILHLSWGIWHYDHHGIDIDLEILGYEFHFEFNDGRHWNFNEDRLYYIDEPEFFIDDEYRAEQYFADVKKFMASCKELDKGYYRRCLLAYKIYMQNGWDLWDTIEPKQILRKFRSIDFCGGIYGIDKRGRRFELSKHGKRSLYVKGNVTINILPPRFVFPFVNIYDKNGKLLSKMKDYRRGWVRARDLQEKR